MTTINITSKYGEETIKGLILEGLNEERRKTKYALQVSESEIRKYEEYYGISTISFLDKFKKGDFKESDETFKW